MSNPDSWLYRLKKFLYKKPQNREQLLKLMRDANLGTFIDNDTLAMIEGVMLFSQLKTRDIMLPKKQMTSIPGDATLPEAMRIVTESGHSRFPVTDPDDNNEIIGILHAKDLISFQFHHPQQEDFDAMDIARKATFVPESKRLDTLLAEFRHNRNHMAIVVDEYGAAAGFVTLEDILEQIIGDIEDEFDIDEEAYFKIHEEDHYILKAHTPIEEFNEQVEANFSSDNCDTIGGIVMAKLGHLPRRGETVTINNFRFKILNADARRIKLLECFDLRKRREPASGDNNYGNQLQDSSGRR